jgi:hypothetical protein
MSLFVTVTNKKSCLKFFDRGKDELDFKELGDVEDDGEDDDRHDVGQDYPVPGVDPLALVVVLDGAPHGTVPLQGQVVRL